MRGETVELDNALFANRHGCWRSFLATLFELITTMLGLLIDSTWLALSSNAVELQKQHNSWSAACGGAVLAMRKH